MPRKYIKQYEKLAKTYGDPIEYIFKRMHALKVSGNPGAATDLAKYLVPYGHGKVNNVTQDGDDVETKVVIKIGGDDNRA